MTGLVLALLSFVLTMALLSSILAFTEVLDRRQARRLVRRMAGDGVPVEVAEQLVSEECARLLRGAA